MRDLLKIPSKFCHLLEGDPTIFRSSHSIGRACAHPAMGQQCPNKVSRFTKRYTPDALPTRSWSNASRYSRQMGRRSEICTSILLHIHAVLKHNSCLCHPDLKHTCVCHEVTLDSTRLLAALSEQIDESKVTSYSAPRRPAAAPPTL